MYYISKNPENGFNYAVISVLFSRSNYTKSNHTKESKPIIDSFFDSLELTDLTDVENPELLDNVTTAKEVKLGDLLNFVNLRRRWIYQGSTSLPPCQSTTYWNVLSTIYPISEEHY